MPLRYVPVLPVPVLEITRTLILDTTLDVGGGSVADDTPHTLARIPLRWMIRECFKTNTGIRFHGELLKRIGLDPGALHPVVQPRPPALVPDAAHRTSVAAPVAEGTEEDHEVRDALAPVYDQLSLAWYTWWPLELLPTTKKNKTDWCVGFRSLVLLFTLSNGADARWV